METSQEIGEIAAALAKAQGSIKAAIKDSTNPHFKSKYADLAGVMEAAREPLSANGLSITQWPGECANNQMSMTTMLMHSSGQWLRETLTIPLSKVDAQGYGSATTYARRYALAAAVGIVQDDDDGNAASNPKGADNSTPAKKEPAHSALKTKVRGFVHEMEGCGSKDELDGLIYGREGAELIGEIKDKLPQWWHGGPDMDPDFVPLHRRIEMKEYEFAQQIADFART